MARHTGNVNGVNIGKGLVPMIDTQLLNDVLMTVAFIVGLVVAISVWVVAATALHQRHARAAQISTIEQHLADVAGQTPARTR
jgi:hypothetical protein